MSFIYTLCVNVINSFSVLILLVMWSLLVVGYVIINRRRNFPGGPRGVPILGYLPFLDVRRLHKSLMNLGRRHGDVYSLRIGGQTVVVLNSASVIREAFVNQTSCFDGRPVWMLNKVNQGRGIANEQPTWEWQNHRKAWLKVMRHLMRSKVSTDDMISRDIGRIVSAIESSEGRPFDISTTVQMALCNVICSVCFGKSFSYDDPDFRRLLKMADKFFHYLSSASVVNFFPILWYLPLKSNIAVAEGYKGIFEFVQKLVHEKLSCVNKDEQGGFVDFCLTDENGANILSSSKLANEISISSSNVQMNNGTQNVSHYSNDFTSSGDIEQAAYNMATRGDDRGNEKHVLRIRTKDRAMCESVTYAATDLFIGGAETTHAGVMWGVVFMLLHPGAQTRVQEELDRVIGDERLPAWADRQHLPFTQACLLEILRLGNVIPIAIPHVTTRDVTMSSGCRLPRGTTVMANLYACHMDPTAWDNPQEFRPERFLDSAGVVQRFDDFFPFSIGRRACLGEQLARMELYLAFTHILKKFHISLAAGERRPSIEGRPGITHSPYRFKICALPRKPKQL